MTGNFADLWEGVAARQPQATAILHGGRRTSWASFDARAGGLAATLLAAGLQPGARVAQYLYSGPEYLETVFAAFKARLVPVNTNYRYRDDELVYLWTNAEVAAVVFDAAFTDVVERLRVAVPEVRCWVRFGGDGACPDWAVDFEQAAATAPPAFETRSADDLYLLYTGGTTGMPRGVMWRQGDLLGYLRTSSPTARGRYPEQDVEPGSAWTHLSASPLMHGTGSFTAFQALGVGGTVATLAGTSFDPAELLDLVNGSGVQTVALVGDAFCRPLIAAMDAEPDRWSLGGLRWIVSSGAMWSADVKEALLARNPDMLLIDSLASSEAPGMASAITRGGERVRTGVFHAGPATVLLDERGASVPADGATPGLVAVSGYLPLGYHADPAKTAETFTEHDGRRYSIPGDWATLSPDGTLQLLGRGAACINTGGEKVFAEEVQTVVREHEGVADAVVVGVPDPRLGQMVVAVVEPLSPPPDPEALIRHVKSRLAGYKAPKRVIYTDRIPHGPSGKVDLQHVRALAAQEDS